MRAECNKRPHVQIPTKITAPRARSQGWCFGAKHYFHRERMRGGTSCAFTVLSCEIVHETDNMASVGALQEERVTLRRERGRSLARATVGRTPRAPSGMPAARCCCRLASATQVTRVRHAGTRRTACKSCTEATGAR